MKLNNLKRRFVKNVRMIGLGFGLNKNYTNVLCYHSISSTADKYAVSLSGFKKQAELICRNGKFVGPKELENALKGISASGWNLILTIDDGYQDVKKIIPLTKKLNIPVILFVLSSSKVNRKELANNHKLLAVSEIKKLHKLGWIIGCHTATHAHLSKLNDKELTEEIINSKKTLEKNL